MLLLLLLLIDSKLLLLLPPVCPEISLGFEMTGIEVGYVRNSCSWPYRLFLGSPHGFNSIISLIEGGARFSPGQAGTFCCHPRFSQNSQEKHILPSFHLSWHRVSTTLARRTLAHMGAGLAASIAGGMFEGEAETNIITPRGFHPLDW